MKKYQWLIPAALLLGVVSLFLEQAEMNSGAASRLTAIVDYLILFAVVLELVLNFHFSRYRRQFLGDNRISLAFTTVFLLLFAYNKIAISETGLTALSGSLAKVAVILRGIFLMQKIYGRRKKLTRFMDRLTNHPAQTILLSFMVVILAGSLILMMEFTTVDGRGLPFIDALFTATSAVCVTGLIVVDTAVHFTGWGWFVIMMLIQIGGLGIMILSYFTIFTMRRRVSLSDKLLLSYMLSEEDMSNLSRALSNIVVATIIIEICGAVLLFTGFAAAGERGTKAAFIALFHAVSAFCNAGFALYSDSLEGFRTSPVVVGTVSLLIITGGIGFGVLSNLRDSLTPRIRHPLSRLRRGKTPSLNLNSRIVLRYTAMLLGSGLIAVYLLEHGHAMKAYGLADQYLSAFFQSVTLRTAGFNTIPFDALRDSTYLIMILFMFIGGASGSTAGGIKIGSMSVLLASLRSFVRSGKKTTIENMTVSPERITQAYLILLSGICAVFAGTFILSISESAPFLHLLFEAVSAFGTVGLSAGVTGSLSSTGRLVIVLLMFFGRLGPLTILSAAGSGSDADNISYPQGDISIG